MKAYAGKKVGFTLTVALAVVATLLACSNARAQSPQVIDKNGKEVGPLFHFAEDNASDITFTLEEVLLRINGHWTLLPVSPAGFANTFDLNLYYESKNCTGKALVGPIRQEVPPTDPLHSF